MGDWTCVVKAAPYLQALDSLPLRIWRLWSNTEQALYPQTTFYFPCFLLKIDMIACPREVSSAAAVELFAESGILAMNTCEEAQICRRKPQTWGGMFIASICDRSLWDLAFTRSLTTIASVHEWPIEYEKASSSFVPCARAGWRRVCWDSAALR
jgi:hypothetical protein